MDNKFRYKWWPLLGVCQLIQTALNANIPVNQVIAVPEIGAAMGMIFTIWNLVGSILLAASTAVFHSKEVQTSFSPAFHSASDFNIVFASIVLLGAIWTRVQLQKKSG